MQDRLAYLYPAGISDRFGRFKHPVAQSVEHYEIARYGTLKTWATELGWDQAKQLLEATIAEEKRLTRPSRNLRKTKSTSTLRLPEAAAATDSVRPRPFNKASPHEVALLFATRTQKKDSNPERNYRITVCS